MAALLIVAGAAWYWGSPAYAMHELKGAAIAGDKDDLKKRIDFPKVRESLKGQMSAMMAAEMTKPENDNGFAAFGAMLGMALMDKMIDGFVTPEAMSAMIKQGKMQRDGDAANGADGTPAEWTIERHGFSRFTATPKAAPGEKPPSLVFDRDGLSWTLVRIDLPSGSLGRQIAN
jgi:hypothetical protein